MTDSSSENRRYLALWLPYLPADRLRRATGEHLSCGLAPEVPLAFIEKVKGALRLVAVDQGCPSHLGWSRAWPWPTRGRGVPELAAVDHDPAADRTWLERLADGCIRYTPMVALDAPGG